MGVAEVKMDAERTILNFLDSEEQMEALVARHLVNYKA